ncbi:hypothetical protein R6Z07F_013028 [Ovis aries]
MPGRAGQEFAAPHQTFRAGTATPSFSFRTRKLAARRAAPRAAATGSRRCPSCHAHRPLAPRASPTAPPSQPAYRVTPSPGEGSHVIMESRVALLPPGSCSFASTPSPPDPPRNRPDHSKAGTTPPQENHTDGRRGLRTEPSPTREVDLRTWYLDHQGPPTSSDKLRMPGGSIHWDLSVLFQLGMRKSKRGILTENSFL